MNSDDHDARVHARATAYAQSVVHRAKTVRGGELTEEDIARAFVVAYAAGLEDGRSVVGRRTVRK